MNKKYFLVFLISIIFSLSVTHVYSVEVKKIQGDEAEIIETKLNDNEVITYVSYRNGTIIPDTIAVISPDEMIPVIIEFEEKPLMPYIKDVEAELKIEKNSSTSKSGMKMEESKIIREKVKLYQNRMDQAHKTISQKLKTGFKVGKIKRDYKYIFNGLSTTVKFKYIDEIRKLPQVKNVYKDENLTIQLTTSVSKINADDVWVYKDANATNVTGHNITVAIIDTGIDYTHSDLGGCTQAEFLAGSCERVTYGYDFYNNDNNPMDDHGHGTHCAGIVGANGTLKGVAPNVKFLAYKVCSSGGSCPNSDVISAIENATLYGADVISMSLGGSGFVDSVFTTPIDNAVNNGTVVVVTAGNSGPSEDTIGAPGSTLSAITVGASDDNDNIASFSSRGFVYFTNGSIAGIKPDVVAPGVDIYSTVPIGSCSLCSSNGYRVLSGTSMATPHIAGVAALMKQAHPDWSANQIKATIANTAIDINYNPITQGSGRVDAFETYNSSGTIIENNLHLGTDNQTSGTWSVTRELNITNMLNYTVTFNLSTDIQTSGITATLSNSSITLNDNESAIFNLTINVTNAVVADAVHYGEVIANESGKILRVPFSLKKGTSLTLIFTGEDPWVFYIYNDTELIEYKYRPGSSAEVMLSTGIYDIMTRFYTKDGSYVYPVIVKEDISSEAGTVTIARNDATNKIELTPIDINSDEITTNFGEWGRALQYNDLTFGIFSGLSNAYTYYNNMSTEYNLTLSLFAYPGNDFYWFINYTNGINSSYNFTNSPTSFKQLTYKYHIDNSTINSLTLEHFIATIYTYGHSLIARAFGGSWDQTTLNRPFEHNAYLMPEPFDNCWIEYAYIRVKNSLCPDGVCIKQPYIHVKNTTTVETVLYDWDEPVVYETSGDVLDIGLKPLFWYGRFLNLATEVRIMTYEGSGVRPLKPQTFDFIKHDDISYSLYDNSGSTVTSGTFSTIGREYSSPRYATVSLTSAGKYTLEMTKSYTYNDKTALINVNATFNTSKIFKNPPCLAYFRIYSGGNLTDEVNNSLVNEIKFKVDKFYQQTILALQNVRLEYKNNTIWNTLSVSNTSFDTSFEFNGTFPSFSEGDNVSLRLTMNDSYGNELIQVQEPAFFVATPVPDTTPPNITIVSPVSGKTYNTLWLMVNISLNEAGGKALYSLNSSTNQTMLSLSNTHFYKNITGLVNLTTYNITFYANDTNGNMAKSSCITFSINTSAPSTSAPVISIVSPDTTETPEYMLSEITVEASDDNDNIAPFSSNNNSYFNVNHTLLNYTVTDDASENLTCYYVLDGNDTLRPCPIVNNTYDDVNLTELSESSHEIYVICQDEDPQNGTSSTITVYIDRTAPLVSNPSPSNNSYIKGESSETFQAELSDETSLNTTSGQLMYKFTLEDVSYTSEDLDCSLLPACSASIDLSTKQDESSVYFYLSAKDRAGNQNQTDTLMVTIDGTFPLIYGESKSPTTVNPTDDVTFFVNTTDSHLSTVYLEGNWAGIWQNYTIANNVSERYNYTVSSGNFSAGETVSWRFYVSDEAGNTNKTSLQSFTVNTPGNGGNGGNSGGGGGTADGTSDSIEVKETKTISSIVAGESAAITFKKSDDLKIQEIEIRVKNDVFNVKITVKEGSKPSEATHAISSDEGSVYKYLEIIKSNIVDKDIDKVYIRFKVDKTWIPKSNINLETIAMSRYADDKWNKQHTLKTHEDADYYYFETKSPALSIFAITGEKLVVTTTTITATTTIVSTTTITVPEAEELGFSTHLLSVVIGITILIAVIVVLKYKTKITFRTIRIK